MITTKFQGLDLPLLGFGMMRLPTHEDGTINEEKVTEMVDLARANGLKYIDTAWFYHNFTSEAAVGRVLSKYPRDSFYLATKYPGNQVKDSYDPAETFAIQLKNCQVDYFDFYLLHNVSDSNLATYLDPRWGILDYFREQKRIGKIRHFGFSSHGSLKMLREFLDIAGEDMEFCQIQLNYLDWSLQEAEAKVALLKEYGIPVWVMEPVRGGRLCKLSDESEARLKALRPEDSIASWGFRFLQDIDNVQMILSGMSTMEQMQDNLKTFSARKPLSETERATLLDVAEELKKTVPCTGCRYCVEGCPAGLDIPELIAAFNELRFASGGGVTKHFAEMEADKLPSACVSCGACMQICPQGIEIPKVLKSLSDRLEPRK